MNRILVAASAEGQRRLRGILRGVAADYVTSYAGGMEALLRNEYSRVLIDLLFAESRMLKFARFVHDEQPDARVICVNATGYPLNPAAREETEARLRWLECGSLGDLERVWEMLERRAGHDRRGAPRSRAMDRRGMSAPAF